MLTFFRHKQSTSSTTSHVQGGYHNGIACQTNDTRENSTKSGHKQVQSYKKKGVRKMNWRKTNKKLQTPRGMSLKTEIEQTSNAEKDDDSSSTSEENNSPSPKGQNQKITPPAIARQATLATTLGNPIPTNAKQLTSATGTKYFEIDSPPEKSKQDSPSLKFLIQEMGFSKKTPEYKAGVQFIQPISPKHKTSALNDVIDLTSPAEAEDEQREKHDIFYVETKITEEQKQIQVDEQPNKEEEHGAEDDNTDNNTKK